MTYSCIFLMKFCWCLLKFLNACNFQKFLNNDDSIAYAVEVAAVPKKILLINIITSITLHSF